MKFVPGETVVAVMHSPREKVIGILDEINAAGVAMRAIDLGYFDDWCSAIATGDPYVAMSDQFFPMWRIERITRDESSADIPSMAEQFETRTGQRLDEQ